MNVLNYCRYVKGVKYKVYRTGTFLVKNRKLKDKGLDLWAEPPSIYQHQFSPIIKRKG